MDEDEFQIIDRIQKTILHLGTVTDENLAMVQAIVNRMAIEAGIKTQLKAILIRETSTGKCTKFAILRTNRPFNKAIPGALMAPGFQLAHAEEKGA